MSFATPLVLLLIPAWAALLFLRARNESRRLRLASDHLLWRRAAAVLPPAAARLRPRWRDWILIVPLVALTGALSGPGCTRRDAAPGIIILDRSASMGTMDGGTSRIERGLREARRMLGDSARIVGVPPASDAQSSRASGAEVSTDALLDAVRAHAASRVVVVTDRVLEPGGLPAGVGIAGVGDGARNAGITAAGVRAGAGLLVRVEGDSGAAARNLRIVDDRGAVLLDEAIASPGDPGWRRLLPLAPSVKQLHIELAPPDALAADDVVDLVEADAGVSVAVEGTSLASIQRAILAHPAARLTAAPDPSADLCVGFVGRGTTLLVAPEVRVAGFALGPARDVAGNGAGAGPWEGFDLQHDHWPAVHALVDRPAGTESLLLAEGVPLLVRSGSTFILLVDPDRTGWSTKPSFPLAIKRILERAGASSSLGELVCGQAGVARSVPSFGATRATWRESGSTDEVVVPLGADGRFTVAPDQPGIGTLTASDGRITRLATGVLAPTESTVARARDPQVIAPAPAPRETVTTDLTPAFAWTAAVAMCVLLLRAIVPRGVRA